jgi:hypothetical protein
VHPGRRARAVRTWMDRGFPCKPDARAMGRPLCRNSSLVTNRVPSPRRQSWLELSTRPSNPCVRAGATL